MSPSMWLKFGIVISTWGLLMMNFLSKMREIVLSLGLCFFNKNNVQSQLEFFELAMPQWFGEDVSYLILEKILKSILFHHFFIFFSCKMMMYSYMFCTWLIFRFVAILILPLLSWNIGIGFKIFSTKSHKSLFSHANFLDIVDKSMYFSFDEDRTIVAYFFEIRAIGLAPSLKTKPIIDQPSIKSLIQSMST